MFCLTAIKTFGQIPDSVPMFKPTVIDTAQANKTDEVSNKEFEKWLSKKNKPRFRANPNKSLLYSLIVPGMGQFYNRRYWKVPLVYAAYGGVIYAIDFNRKNFRRFKTAYALKIDGDPSTIDEFEALGIALDATALKNLRDGYQKDLELSYMVGIIVHLLNGVEAFVDAHLKDWDIAEDLSLRLGPETSPTFIGPQAGINLTISF